MKIGFLLRRATYLKTLGALIQATLRRGHSVVLLYTLEDETSDKAYQNISGETLVPFAKEGAEIIKFDLADLPLAGKRHGFEVLVTEEGYHTLREHLQEITALRDAGTRVVSLSSFFEVTQWPLGALESFDKTFYLSEFARDLHFELQASQKDIVAEKRRLASRIEVTSSPAFDQLHQLDRKAARAEFGLPPDKKVVLLMAPVIDPTTPWRFHVWRDAGKLNRLREALKAGKLGFVGEILLGDTFRDVLSAIKVFCVRNNALLVVKSRGKQKDPAYLVESADLYLDGLADSYFPLFSSYKLLGAADLCITVNSMAALEAVAAGVPCINIYVPHLDRHEATPPARARYFEVLLGGAPGSLMNYPGCIHKVDRRQAVAWFQNHNLEDVMLSKQKREEYRRKFLGMREQSASQQVLDALQPQPAAPTMGGRR